MQAAAEAPSPARGDVTRQAQKEKQRGQGALRGSWNNKPRRSFSILQAMGSH